MNLKINGLLHGVWNSEKTRGTASIDIAVWKIWKVLRSHQTSATNAAGKEMAMARMGQPIGSTKSRWRRFILVLGYMICIYIYNYIYIVEVAGTSMILSSEVLKPST